MADDVINVVTPGQTRVDHHADHFSFFYHWDLVIAEVDAGKCNITTKEADIEKFTLIRVRDELEYLALLLNCCDIPL